MARHHRMGLGLVALAALTGSLGLGCAARLQPPAIGSSASLGKVIIYRNGVAYFERFASPEEEKLSLSVPSERVDDFLKSLTIVDDATGEAMPVSYPTLDTGSGTTTMTIDLPPSHERLRISYVTESPTWKPSYRVMLEGDGKARMQGWAVVDNVSGEDWQNVQIGVGSTSALSFRYDLHSVLLVEREQLSSGSLVALAPPSGGSPYAAGGKKTVRVFANMRSEDVAKLDDDREVAAYRQQQGQLLGGQGYGAGAGATGASDEPNAWAANAPKTGHRPATKPSPNRTPTGGRAGGYAMPDATTMPVVTAAFPANPMVDNLARELRNSNERVRIEGLANAGDSDPRQASLDRANALRTSLIARGIPAEQIDAVGTGELSSKDGVRVVGTSEPLDAKEAEKTKGKQEAPPPPGAPVPGADEGQPLGSAHFLSEAPMSIERDHSAMVSIVNAETEAKRIYYFDPVSERGSTRYAFNAVRIVNPSEYTLDSGPFTVYTDGQFLGEGLAEPILPKSVAFIPYALDRSIVADTGIDTREEIDKLLTIQRGIVNTETRRIRRTKLTLTNRHTEEAEVYVRHLVQPGYELMSGKAKVEKLGGAYLFPVVVKGGEALELVIEESTPIHKTVDINTALGIEQMTLFLKHEGKLEPELKHKLDDIVRTYTAVADLEQKIQLGREQMGVYRTRVDELTLQLADLRKVKEAEKLRKHLSDKMEEISERLQKSTIDMADLQGQLMTKRIELQDQLADLTLKKKKGEAGKA
ncbi:MAG: hypothetical protein IT373_16175 [Polyangiaceae bacterium]|nr:hypothetical protein [Polyangiaceae bacterium]